MIDELTVAAVVLAAAALAGPGRHLTTRARLAELTATAGWVADEADRADSADAPGQGDHRRASGGAAPAVALGVAAGLLVAAWVRGVPGAGLGVMTCVTVGLVAWRAVRHGPVEAPVEPALLAGTLDLLAAGLRCGLPVASAVLAAAGQLPGPEGRVLVRVAELLGLGADPATAWRAALDQPAIAALATTAIRTARSGAAMASAVDELAAGLRAAAGDRAEARAQRAGVLITGPLGLCFLPAFFCLGVLPVVMGLAGQLLDRW